VAGPIAALTATDSCFDDFAVGQEMRPARGCSVDEAEKQMLTQLVMNSADGHFDRQELEERPFGQRLVLGPVTGSIVIGLATQDTGENALAELSPDGLRLRAPAFHGDTLTACTEGLARRRSHPGRR
jgi:acyl dehydratase